MTDQSPTAWIVNTTTETFEKDVLERSQETLVVVDFWAPWCQPCLMLMPLMEKVTNQFAGRFDLVKVDIDQLQAVAQQFGVQQVPTVLAFYQGQPLDGFQGLIPEEQLKEWVERLLLTIDVEKAVQQEDDDPATAEATYRRALEQQPNETALLVGLGRALLGQGKNEEAQAIVAQLDSEEVSDNDLERLKAKLEFTEHRKDNVQELRDAAESAPDDFGAQHALAEALASRGDFTDALDICLRLIEAEPKGAGKEAKRLMLDVFKILPEGSDIVKTYRAKLTTLLF